MASEVFESHIDLTNNELQNASYQNLTVHPSTVGKPSGWHYYNTTDSTPYVWTGTVWKDMASLYTHPIFTGTGQPANALSGAQVISRIILDNGHTSGVVVRTLTPADIGASNLAHTHGFSDIVGLPSMSILGNKTTGTGSAQALTQGDVLTLLGIAYGEYAELLAGTATSHKTWTAKMLTDWLNVKLNSYLTVVNLGYTASPTNGTVTNSAGTSAVIPAGSTTNASLMLPEDKTKLNTVAQNANNYQHPTDNPGVHPFATELTSGTMVLAQVVVNSLGHVIQIKGRNLTTADIAGLMINDALNNSLNQTWSGNKIFTEIQNAVTTAQTGVLQYKGDYNPQLNLPNLGADTNIKTGFSYVVSAEGTFAGDQVESGDMLIARVDNPGTTPANWQIVNRNIPAIQEASTLVKGIIQLATAQEAIAGTNDAKAITPATLKAVLDSRVGGYSATIGDGTTLVFNITHPLNTQDVTIQVQRISDRQIIHTERRATSTTSVRVAFNNAITNASHRVIIKS